MAHMAGPHLFLRGPCTGALPHGLCGLMQRGPVQFKPLQTQPTWHGTNKPAHILNVLHNNISKRGSAMKAWLQRFMYGRYGQDHLNRALSIFAIVLYGIALFTKWTFLSSLAMVLLLFCIFRMLSRSTEKRARENGVFLRFQEGVRQTFRQAKTRFQQRKTYRFYTCAACKQKVRVPKGKGKIIIHCPKCHASFEKKS